MVGYLNVHPLLRNGEVPLPRFNTGPDNIFANCTSPHGNAAKQKTLFWRNCPLQEKSRFSSSFSAHTPPRHLTSYHEISLLSYKKNFVYGKKRGFHLRSLPTHHHATWPLTMEDEEKSGLQTSLGDCVFWFPLCRAFGPSYFLWCSSARRSHCRLPAHMDTKNKGNNKLP